MNRWGLTAFERLFEEHAEPLFAFLVYRTGDRQLAEEVVADTFERVLRTRVRFDPRRGSEKNWIYAIALNLARDELRRRSVETRTLEQVGVRTGGEPQYVPVDEVADRDELSQALGTLSDEEREALSLRFGSDLPVREVAKLLNENEDAMEKRISRALKKLRSEMRPQD